MFVVLRAIEISQTQSVGFATCCSSFWFRYKHGPQSVSIDDSHRRVIVGVDGVALHGPFDHFMLALDPVFENALSDRFEWRVWNGHATTPKAARVARCAR